jgi:O-antigen/teichoic acid export membrane protein
MVAQLTKPWNGNPEPTRASVGTHYLRYATGNALVMIAGFVSFPIMTRLLSTEQYGIFGYFDAWLLILAGVCKLGAQHTILRFYPHGAGQQALVRYGANFILLPFLASGALWLCALLVYAGITRIASHETAAIGWIMLALLLPAMWISYVGAFAFAAERSDISVRIVVGQRWAETATVLGIVYFVERSALGVYAARLLVAVVLAIGLTFWLHRRLPLRLRAFDSAGYREGLRYGLPLVANEIATTLLAFADRVMLRQMLRNFADVGVYTIGYGLALNINNMFNFALYNAYTQVSIREFETKGCEAVLRTKRTVLHALVYLAVAMIAGLLTVGPDMLLLLAGGDKTASARVFVLIGVIYTLDGLFGICGAGLLLFKRSRTVLVLTLGAALLNIMLNLFAIPHFGMIGAVYASAASFAALNLGRYFTCPRELRALPDLRATLVAVGLGGTCVAIAHSALFAPLHSHLLRIATMAVLVATVYAIPVFVLDTRLRESVLRYWHGRKQIRA